METGSPRMRRQPPVRLAWQSPVSGKKHRNSGALRECFHEETVIVAFEANSARRRASASGRLFRISGTVLVP
jgi:hypothetical protein